MKNKNSTVADWAVDVDWKALMNYTDAKDTGLDVQRLFVSDVALAVCCACRAEAALSDSDREGLGRLLRFLAGIAEQIGLIVPALGVLDIRKDGDGQTLDRSVVMKWAADQDWHRGDFSIIVVDGDVSPEDLLEKLLGSVSTAWSEVELRPRDLETILNAFESARRARRLSAEHESLLNAMDTALREGSGRTIEKWLDDRFSEVRGLMTGREEHG